MCLCVSSQWVVVLFWYGIHVANVATWGHASAISTGQIGAPAVIPGHVPIHTASWRFISSAALLVCSELLL